MYNRPMSAVLTAGGAPLPASLANFVAKPEEKKQAIAKIRYSHDAMIDQIVANPWVSQGELAQMFGYTEGWVSQVIASDAFQGRLAERKDALIDPTIRATLEERFKAMANSSLQILLSRLNDPNNKVSDETALKAAEIAAKALGMGVKSTKVEVNNSFVVAVPQKAASTADWAAQNGAGGQAVSIPSGGRTIEHVSKTPALVDSGSSAPINTAQLLSLLKGG